MSVVLTFDPHPSQVLHGDPPPLVCDIAERIELFEHLGVDTTVVQRFDRDFADQSPAAFLSRLATERALWPWF